MDLRMTPEQLATLDPGQQQLYAARPQWVFVVYAIAVFSGLAGAIGLLLRQRWASTYFLVSLVAVVIHFGYTLFVMDAIGVLGARMAPPFPLVLLAFPLFLLGLPCYATPPGL